MPTIYEIEPGEQTLSQMSSKLSTKQEMYPEKYENNQSSLSMRSQTKMKHKSPSDNLYGSQQCQSTETSGYGERLTNKLYHMRAPENLFLEFRPQAMSTLKRPPLEEGAEM